MTADAGAWQCVRCHRLAIELPDGRRGRQGHLRDVCATCSTDEADEDLARMTADAPLVWLVARLRGEVLELARQLA